MSDENHVEEPKEEKKEKCQRFNSKTISKHFWVIATVVLVVLLSISLIYNSNAAISKEKAQEIVLEFIKEKTGEDVQVVDVELQGSLYQVTVNYRGQSIPLYLTSDGENIANQVMPVTGMAVAETNSQTQAQPETTEIPKSDKPIVEAFVFSYCPYGLQFEKALLPAYELLKDYADIRLVAIGAMHGEHEKTESLRQICIEENYGKDKLWAYLEEFMGDTKIGECNSNMACSKPLVEAIMTSLNINKEKINQCIVNDAEELYNEQNSRASELGIRGSPSFTINGVQVQAGRNPESIKEAVCSAFNDAPEVCDQELDSESASAWFGYSASSGNSNAQC